jgi:hypothetical protein
MWVLLVTSGMRPSEVLGLPWAAVDLEAGVLSIYQKLIKVENRAVLADGTKVDHTGAAAGRTRVHRESADWSPASGAHRCPILVVLGAGGGPSGVGLGRIPREYLASPAQS